MKTSWAYPVWAWGLALLKRQGNTLIDAPKLWRNMDGNQVAAASSATIMFAARTRPPNVSENAPSLSRSATLLLPRANESQYLSVRNYVCAQCQHT